MAATSGIRLDALHSIHPPAPWILTFAGISRDGAKRAESICRDALDKGYSVVLLTGTPIEVPVNPQPGSVVNCWIVDYSEQESETTANRLARFGSSAFAPGSTLGKLIRRAGNIGRGRSGWKLMRGHVDDLSRFDDPAQILYCDEAAFVAAWHAARIWPDVEVGAMQLGP